MTDKTNSDRNAAAIERDVVETQDEIGETIEKLEDKLTPGDVARGIMGEDSLDVAKEAIEVARRNPMPVALIAIGAVWLFATSDAPIIKEMRRRLTGGRSNELDRNGLQPRSAEPAPIGPPPTVGEEYDRPLARSRS